MAGLKLNFRFLECVLFLSKNVKLPQLAPLRIAMLKVIMFDPE